LEHDLNSNDAWSVIMLNKHKIFTRLFFIVGIAVFFFLSGCSSVVNKPYNFSYSSFKAPKKNSEPVRVAVRTSFANGSKSVHFKRADDITREIVQKLNSSNAQNFIFFIVCTFDPLSGVNYDYLLELDCRLPIHETKRNNTLLLLGWPATLSIVAAPLGIAVLSIPGIVKETAEFDWIISISPKYDNTLKLAKKEFSPPPAIVSSSAWGTKKIYLEESYKNTDSHVKAVAIDFVCKLNWEDLNNKVCEYARTHPAVPANQLEMGASAILADTSNKQPIDKRFAVIIGISQYLHASEKTNLTNLLYADDDALAVQQLLIQNGWPEDRIRLLVNNSATKRDIGIALESWLTMANNDDLIMLFWAGHAYPDPEDPEKIYFACHDTDIKIPSTGYRMDQVRRVLEERGTRNVLLIADTCHAGKLITRGKRGLTVKPYLEKIKRETNIPHGWIFMVGAEADRQSIEDVAWHNGAFTHCLLQGLNGEADGYESAGPKDGMVTMGEIRAYMNSAMPLETLNVLGVAKHPIITTSTGDPTIWNLPFMGSFR